MKMLDMVRGTDPTFLTYTDTHDTLPAGGQGPTKNLAVSTTGTCWTCSDLRPIKRPKPPLKVPRDDEANITRSVPMVITPAVSTSSAITGLMAPRRRNPFDFTEHSYLSIGYKRSSEFASEEPQRVQGSPSR
jgi:hypothetical protein